MYKIGLRSGSPVSAGHMMEIDGTEAYTDVSEGDVVCIVNGVMMYSPNECPDAIVSSITSRATIGDNNYPEKAVVMLLTPDMFLEAPVSGTEIQISNLSAGRYIGYTSSDVDAGGTSEFCQIIDTLGAKKAGDKILVRFVKKEVTA